MTNPVLSYIIKIRGRADIGQRPPAIVEITVPTVVGLRGRLFLFCVIVGKNGINHRSKRYNQAHRLKDVFHAITPLPILGKRLGVTAQFRWCNCEVEFFVRRYKNPQAVAELQARFFVKYGGKSASKCANRKLRGDAPKEMSLSPIARREPNRAARPRLESPTVLL